MATPKLKIVDEAPKTPFNLRRFGLADVTKRGPWLIERLKDRYAGATGLELTSWLNGTVMSNLFWFMQTDRAVACAQIVREALSPHPKVMELFVLCEDGAENEGGFLYSEMRAWAAQIGADELRIENLTNVPRDLIKERIGKLFMRDDIYAKIDQTR